MLTLCYEISLAHSTIQLCSDSISGLGMFSLFGMIIESQFYESGQRRPCPVGVELLPPWRLQCKFTLMALLLYPG